MFRATNDDPELETVHLGQFTDAHAEDIVVLLEGADIHHWTKSSGRFSRVVFGGDWGTHLFVDSRRLDEARALAATIAN